MKRTFAAFAVAFACTLAAPVDAQSQAGNRPTIDAGKSRTMIPIAGKIVLVEPANLGAPRSRSVVVAGNEEYLAWVNNYDPAVARRRWKHAHGSRNFYIERGEFERMQKVAHNWELAFLGMSAVDAAQTIHTVSNGHAIELNPLLGRKPSAGKIIAFKAVTSGLHYALFRYANARNPNTARKAAIASFALQSGYVGFSLALGH